MMRDVRLRQIGDEELNFTDEEARRIGPVRVATRRVRVPARDAEADGSGAGFFIFILVIALISAVVFSQSRSKALPQNAPAPPVVEPAREQTSEQQAPQPEYFPAGWDFINVANPTEMYRGTQLYWIPKGCEFLVSLRSINGLHLAVAKDGSWNGWVKVSGYERQVRIDRTFAGAKAFVEKLDWNLLESSYSTAAPSQEANNNTLETLRVLEAQIERNDMSLFQKKDKQEPAEITVQGEEAIIPQPPESDQEEKKVKLPKLKWYAEEGAPAPSFSNWHWVCASRGQMYCSLQDGAGRYVQTFMSDGRSIRSGRILTEASRPQAWGCEMRKRILYCTIQDGRGQILQGCLYDGRTLDCGN
jgi:hypothetical protein